MKLRAMERDVTALGEFIEWEGLSLRAEFWRTSTVGHEQRKQKPIK